jgi:DNA-binding response OmpR family regulator
MATVSRDPWHTAPRQGESSQARSSGGVALVMAGPGPIDRLVADLVLLGYRPTVHDGNGPSSPDPRPVVAVVLTDDVRRDAVPWSEELRSSEGLRGVPVLWMLVEPDLRNVVGNEHLLDELVTVPYLTDELAVRLAILRYRSAEDRDGAAVRRGPLVVDPVTYQASIDGRVLDLTFMEYELLKLLVGYPGRVYTREEILALVWGYDYFGGMRTVDVHVRRLRSKLGPDHAWVIETVRGVGYRLAQMR